MLWYSKVRAIWAAHGWALEALLSVIAVFLLVAALLSEPVQSALLTPVPVVALPVLAIGPWVWSRWVGRKRVIATVDEWHGLSVDFQNARFVSQVKDGRLLRALPRCPDHEVDLRIVEDLSQYDLPEAWMMPDRDPLDESNGGLILSPNEWIANDQVNNAVLWFCSGLAEGDGHVIAPLYAEELESVLGRAMRAIEAMHRSRD